MTAGAHTRMAAAIRQDLELGLPMSDAVPLVVVSCPSEEIAYQVWLDLTPSEQRGVRFCWPGQVLVAPPRPKEARPA